jgi:hypothetical protein
MGREAERPTVASAVRSPAPATRSPAQRDHHSPLAGSGRPARATRPTTSTVTLPPFQPATGSKASSLRSRNPGRGLRGA